MPDTKIAIIGCGKQAPKHLSGLKKGKNTEIVVADVDKKKGAEFAEKHGVQFIDNINQVFSDTTIDAVDICTPTPSHFELIIKSLESDKHFFCEKPLCENQEQIETICTLARQKQIIGMVGFIYRFSPVFEKAKQICKSVPDTGYSDEIGKIVSANFRIGGRGSDQAWKHRIASGGGAINEMLVHMLDLIVWFFGRIKNIDLLMCDTLRSTRNIRGTTYSVDAEDYVLIKFRTENNIIVTCQADLITPAFWQTVEINGEKGSFVGSIQPQMPSFLYCEENINGYHVGRNEIENGYVNLFENQMTEFVKAIESNSQPPRGTLEEALYLQGIIDNIKNQALGNAK